MKMQAKLKKPIILCNGQTIRDAVGTYTNGILWLDEEQLLGRRLQAGHGIHMASNTAVFNREALPVAPEAPTKRAKAA